MAMSSGCNARIPGVCRNIADTVVAAHSNYGEHGKGMARKADDCYVIYACHACHSWMDQGKASAEAKRSEWDLGFARQRKHWRRITEDPLANHKDKAAAQWALDRIKRAGASGDDQGENHER